MQAVCRIVSPNVRVKLFVVSASNRLPAYFFGRPVFLAFKHGSCYKDGGGEGRKGEVDSSCGRDGKENKRSHIYDAYAVEV